MPIVSARWEYDSLNRVAAYVTKEMTEDGIRTHIKFLNDVPGIPGDLEGARVLASMCEDIEDETRAYTPKALSESESSAPDALLDAPSKPSWKQLVQSGSVSSNSSGSMGINHWTRQAPVIPSAFAGLPGSDVATEIGGNYSMAPNRASVPPPNAFSHCSGPTLAPESVGRARPGSAYYQFQESGLRSFNTQDPATNRRAQAHILIQRCDATDRNLSSLRNNNQNNTGLSSIQGTARFVSPAPSGQIPPPPLYIRDETPFSERNEVVNEADSSPKEPSFDYIRWTWKPKPSFDPRNCASTSPSATLATIHEIEQEQTNIAGSRTGEANVEDPGNLAYTIFGRPDSPLTVLDEGEIPGQEHELSSLGGAASAQHVIHETVTLTPTPRRIRQLPTPQSSPITNANQILTRKQARQLEATHCTVTRGRAKQLEANWHT